MMSYGFCVEGNDHVFDGPSWRYRIRMDYMRKCAGIPHLPYLIKSAAWTS